ncbi:MAG: alanine racemase [Bacteroidia bacterium]|nr:alanine racemase [Bacteroidia bacterium]
MTATSHIEISKSALANNISFIKDLLGDTELSSVVKGNAYGHGIKIIAPLLYKSGVKHFSVFSADEAVLVRECLPKSTTVMIMGFIDNDEIEWAIKNNVQFFVFDKHRLNKAIEVAKALKKKAGIHIEIETGMNRTGFKVSELKSILELLKSECNNINICGVCSHLAGAESISNYKRVTDQVKRFSKVQRAIQKLDWLNPKYHLACSAASIQYPKTKLDLARIGILQYGFFPSNEVYIQYINRVKELVNPLQRIISWKSRVMDIKEVDAGEFVGYGTSFFTNDKTKIAIVPIGYAHGFSRSLSNQGKVLIRGNRFDVIGIVNMNVTIVNITGADNIITGDEVVIIGNQGEQEISVSSFGDFSDMVNYELLTRLPERINRKIIK